MVGRPWFQSGYSSAIDVADVQAVIAVRIIAERVARGYIQQVAFRAAYVAPTRHEAAARRPRRRKSFTRRGNLISVPKLDDVLQPLLQPRQGLVRRGTRL